MNTPGDAYIEWKDWDETTFGKFTSLDASYYGAETSITGDSPPRLLEIGFGNGSFLGWIKSLGGETFGVETNAVLNERARILFGPDCFFEDLRDTKLDRLQSHFTHIVAFDVIEHISIEHLPGLLERLRDLLTADGRLILRFPNGDSPFGRMIQHGDPTHVTTMGQHKLVYLARNAGLRVVEIRAPALPLHGVGWAGFIKRAGVKLGRYCVERLFSVLYYGGQRIPLDSNYVAVLVRARSD